MFRYCSLALLFLVGSSITVQSAPNIQVQVGSTPIAISFGGTASGVSIVDFGTAEIGKSVSKTFTVKNTGTETVNLLEPIKVPAGFTLMRRFGSTALAPGRATTFVAALNSARAGRLGGSISFTLRGSQDQRVTIPVAGSAFGSPSMRIIPSGDVGFRTIGKWVPLTVQTNRGTAHSIRAGTGTSVASWTFSGLQPGQYRVAATWSVQANHATNAPFTVVDGTKAFTTVSVNQQSPPADFHDAGVSWKTLGIFRITGNSLVVRLTDQANGTVLADAVRIEKVGFPGQIIQPGDKGFNQAGAGKNSQTIWTFSGLVPGQYRVSANWAAGNTRFTLLDGAKGLTTVEVNQRQSPKDFRDGGTTWKDLGPLGTLYRITGNTLVVRMTGETAPGKVGSLRVERIYNPAGTTVAEGGTSYGDVVRYLEQGTWGPNDALIQYVQSIGISAHVLEQLGTPTSDYPQPPLMPTNQNTGCPDPQTRTACVRDNYSVYPLQNRFFTKAFYEQDQLHQRMTWALHKIWVISGRDANVKPAAHIAAYLRALDRNALGNFRTLMQDITLIPGMGKYLDMEGSSRANPNENYAREIMQLFTIGLNELNPDGTLQLDDSGNPIPTYTQDTVYAFARLFTGWILAPNVATGIPDYISPMRPRTPETTYHDRNPKTLLNGFTTMANRSALQDLNDGLDNLFYYHNVGPFICKNLIQQLVTSNPSPDYVARVTASFEDNGSGVRGDLATVVFNILLDPEARGDAPTDPSYGKLREPVQYITNLCRAFPVTSYNDPTQPSDGYLNPQGVNLDQDAFNPYSVFSYFPPDNLLPGSTTLLAPEFDLLTTSTAIRRANFINQMTSPNGGAASYGINVSTNAPLGTKLDLTTAQSLAGDPAALLGYLNNIMLHGTMSQDMVNMITPAINAVAASNPLRRAKVAVYLVATSSQYQVQQ